MVETARPPTTARAKGTIVSFPSPKPSASGSNPRIVARAVIRIGRMRWVPAWNTACSAVAPARTMRFA